MKPDAAAFADMVVLTVKTALAPLQERLAVAEQSNRDLQARLQDLAGLRDRLVAIETKSATPTPDTFAGELRDRLTVLETKMAMPSQTDGVIEDIRQRLTVADGMGWKATETRQVADPVQPVDLSPVLERLAAAEARVDVLGDLRDRVVTIETKALAAPLPAPPLDLGPVVERLAAVERRFQIHETETTPVLSTVTDLTKDMGALRERVAVVEVRAQMPGPPGKDGTPGKDGADGVGFDDLVAVQQDDRSFTIKAARGDRVKDIGTARFPVQIQRGVYLENKSYEHGDVVTWGGSQWHANEDTTTKPGDGSKAWTLIVKRGRDGRDGKDATDGLPVVAVGRT